VANNGLEGLNLIRETDRLHRRAEDVKLYDCILMDLEMPIMDGLTAVKEIRMAEAAGTLSRQMVIALTGNARQGQIDQAIEAGMDDGT
jgi:CheY-like chemotaxis protein